jgi:lysophospholipase L1-like esterase
MQVMDRWPNEFRKMVALGESTTAGGWSTSRERCWVSLLASMLNDYQSQPLEFFNAGLGANLISTRSPCYAASSKPAANERLDHHVISQNPDLLIISYGLNDARGGTPLELFLEELLLLIQRTRAQISPLIVLVGPYYMSDAGWNWSEPEWAHADINTFRTYNQGIRETAAREACLFADLLGICEGVDWVVHYDGVHANDIGHRLVANRIFEVLACNCSGVAKNTKEIEKTSPRWRDESMLKTLPSP